jgi:hypothetical protein
LRAPKSTVIALLVASSFSRLASQDRQTLPTPVVSDLAKSYRTALRKINDQEILVNPDLAALCIGVSQARLASVSGTFGPHANCAINIFMNEAAEKSFAAGARIYPVGSVIIKEKRAASYVISAQAAVGGDFRGVGGMVKRAAGFDPEHDDWEYFYFDHPSNIEQGRISSCIACHSSARSSDYIFGSWSGAHVKSRSTTFGDSAAPLKQLAPLPGDHGG